MQLKAGSRLQSQVCATQIIVVKAPADAVDVTCGGVSMLEPGSEPDADATAAEGMTGGTGMGKRYVDADDTIEVLCTKPGDGTLGLGEIALNLKEAKVLPASD